MKPGIYLTEKEILEQKTDLPPIKKILNAIQNPHIKAFTKEALEKAPDRFWLDPCSIKASRNVISRKYHNPITLTVPGGIVNHSTTAVYFAIEGLRRRPCFRIDINKTSIEIFPLLPNADGIFPKPIWQDRTISAILLHDACKNGDNKNVPWGGGTHPGHGELAAEFIKKIPSFKKLRQRDQSLISNGIKWHMGHLRYSFAPKGEKFTESASKSRFTEFEKVIQEADFYSTRVFLTGIDFQLINYPSKSQK